MQKVQHIYPSKGPGMPEVVAFYHAVSGSWQYLVADVEAKQAAVIDPVMDFDPVSGQAGHDPSLAIWSVAKDRGWEVVWAIDTHPHADHMSALGWWRERGVRTVIGAKVVAIQAIWADIYADPLLDGWDGGWSVRAHPGTVLHLGGMEMRALAGWGHTLGSLTWVVGDAIFAHDTLMMPDSGTARADFPGGSVEDLWESVRAILDNFSDSARVFVGHDYGKDGRPPACMATVGAHRAQNIHVRDGQTRDAFVAMRRARDAVLPLPHLMLLALQVNLRGGEWPPADAEGRIVLRLPVGRFPPAA